MLLRWFISALALSAITAADAVAAENVVAVVSPVAGDVSVSRGKGFQKILAPAALPAGTQVMVGPQGSATIAYAGDCVVPVKPAGVTVIASWSPCRALPEPMHFTPRVGEERKTSAEAPPPPPAQPQSSSTTGTGSNDQSDNKDSGNLGTYVVIGGVVVGAGVLAAVLASQGGDGPISP